MGDLLLARAYFFNLTGSVLLGVFFKASAAACSTIGFDIYPTIAAFTASFFPKDTLSISSVSTNLSIALLKSSSVVALLIALKASIALVCNWAPIFLKASTFSLGVNLFWALNSCSIL